MFIIMLKFFITCNALCQWVPSTSIKDLRQILEGVGIGFCSYSWPKKLY
jgi:hypothetical protein